MANIHDYIILNKKLDKYSKVLEDNLGVTIKGSPVERRRLGFYIYILEHVCKESDVIILSDLVIDTQFNRAVFGKGYNDCGIDAIHIDDELKEVKLFNFKYRDSFNQDSTQKLNDNFTSTKFLNLIIQENLKVIEQYPEHLARKFKTLSEIFVRPQDEWKVELYQVSNEANEVRQVDGELDDLAKMYAIEIKALALPTISSFMSIRPDSIDASVILESEAVMSYSENNKASAKSFIARMKCSEILRMTCNLKELRGATSLEDAEVLQDSYLDFGVLFDNVRGLVKRSGYNKNIATTLKKDPKKFFMYNNGITLIAENIKSKLLPGKKNIKLDVSGIQIVNGGQTLRTIHDFNQESGENLEDYLYDAEVLVRMFMPDAELNEAHKVAEYTNSQNPIKAVDLKSLAAEQIELERYLDEHDIAYARKSGDTGPQDEKEYDHTINMETFGKILKAMSGHPEKATNSVKDIFENGYEKLFIDDFDMEGAPGLIKKYFEIIKLYKTLEIKSVQLKYFYVMYFNSIFNEKGIDFLIKKLESYLEIYTNNNDVSIVKALGSAAFKNEFNKELRDIQAGLLLDLQPG